MQTRTSTLHFVDCAGGMRHVGGAMGWRQTWAISEPPSDRTGWIHQREERILLPEEEKRERRLTGTPDELGLLPKGTSS